MKIASFIVIIAVAASADADKLTMQYCTAILENQWPTYHQVSVEGELLQIKNEYKYDPTVVIGDFDGDDQKDIVLLLEQFDSKINRAIGVCLSSKGTLSPMFIDTLYVNEGTIHLSPKGKKYYNHEKNKEGKYITDGIAISCCECCGATYIYVDGQFEQIIDAD